MIVYELQRSPFSNKNQNPAPMFCNMGVGEDGEGKTQTLANVVRCSSWIFLGFLATGVFHCRKVFHWIFSAALPNAPHAVWFLTQKCYFNRHCTKKKASFVHVSVNARVYLPLLCGSLLVFPFPAGAVRGWCFFSQPQFPARCRQYLEKKAPSPSLLLTASVCFPKHGAWCPLLRDSTA